MTFTPTEHEVFALRSATETLDEMLNHAIFHVFEGDEAYLVFEGPAEERLFSVFLVDFLSKPAASLVGMHGSHIDVLDRTARSPVLNVGADAVALGLALAPFTAWLNGTLTVDVWFDSLGRSCPVVFQRAEVACIAGNMAKHNVGRLTAVTAKFEEIVTRFGVHLRREEIRETVSFLHERFASDVLPYHANALAEMLNNIRWAVHDYLEPVYRASLRIDTTDSTKYWFEYPADVQDGVARSCFWELMNEVRRRPFIERFTVGEAYKVPDELKGQY